MKRRWLTSEQEMNRAFRKGAILLLLFYGCVAWLIVTLAGTVAGQEIVGPEEVATNQPCWLKLDLPEGYTGKFDSHLLDIDPEHVAPGAAMFFAVAAGEFRVIAAVVDDKQDIQFVEHYITVTGDGAEPSPDKITRANVLKWLQAVPEAVRQETITHPITEQESTRQAAVSTTFTSIGNAGEAIASIPGLDLMLSAALVSAIGDSADEWKPFGASVDTALGKLKATDPTAKEYAAAFLTIGEALQ